MELAETLLKSPFLCVPSRTSPTRYDFVFPYCNPFGTGYINLNIKNEIQFLKG